MLCTIGIVNLNANDMAVLQNLAEVMSCVATALSHDFLSCIKGVV